MRRLSIRGGLCADRDVFRVEIARDGVTLTYAEINGVLLVQAKPADLLAVLVREANAALQLAQAWPLGDEQ